MEIPDDQIPLLIRALEHYTAYLAATKREDRAYVELVESLKRKGPAKEEVQERTTKKKRA